MKGDPRNPGRVCLKIMGSLMVVRIISEIRKNTGKKIIKPTREIIKSVHRLIKIIPFHPL